MNATEELRACTSHAYASRFFLKIGQAGQGRWRDENTLPLFGLPLILEAEGLLSRDYYQYLARCEDAIRREQARREQQGLFAA